jgi:hypothetical protein
VHKSTCRGASPPRLNHDLHAIDATPARWCGDVCSSPLDGASAATSSSRNDFAKNYRVRPTHCLICAQVVTLNNHPKIKEWNAAKNPKLPWYEPEN